MKLYLRALTVSIKYALKAAALPLVALLLCLLPVLFSGAVHAPMPRPSVGIRCLDTHPMVPLLTTAVTTSPQVEEFARLHLLAPNESTDGLDAVITLPEGFTESILTGKNLSPTVELRSTGISSVYIGELCTAVERYLSSAQAGIYATMEAVPPLSDAEYTRVLTEINLQYVSLFLNRLSMLSKKFQSFDSYYLLRCVTTVLLFLLCGCLGSALPPLLTTARSMGRIKGSGLLLFAGGCSGVFLCSLPITQLCLTVAFGGQAWQTPMAAIILSALLTAVSFFFFTAVGSSGTASILLCGFTLVTALFSGIILPLEILPGAMATLAPLFPIYHVRMLVTALSGGYSSGLLAGAGMQTLFWLAAAGLFWVKEVRRR
ncbi:MAG: ABC transporter permease [Angelakisella sp.]